VRLEANLPSPFSLPQPKEIPLLSAIVADFTFALPSKVNNAHDRPHERGHSRLVGALKQ